MDVDGVEALGPGEGADDDLAQFVGRFEQKAPLDGAAGDFHECPFWGNESQASSHTDDRDGIGLLDLSQEGGTFSEEGGTFSAATIPVGVSKEVE